MSSDLHLQSENCIRVGGVWIVTVGLLQPRPFPNVLCKLTTEAINNL